MDSLVVHGIKRIDVPLFFLCLEENCVAFGLVSRAALEIFHTESYFSTLFVLKELFRCALYRYEEKIFLTILIFFLQTCESTASSSDARKTQSLSHPYINQSAGIKKQKIEQLMKIIKDNDILDDISGGGSDHGRISEAELRANLNSMTDEQLKTFEKEVNETLAQKRSSK